MRRLNYVLFLILSVISFVSCSDEDLREMIGAHENEISFSETHTGKGSLAFTVEGVKVHQSRGGYLGGIRLAYYREHTERDQIEIFSMLNSNIFYTIRFVFPSDELKAAATIRPDVELTYFPEGNNLQCVTVNDAIINITYCENSIISGRFMLDGEYADSTGEVHIIDITDGIFDLKESV